MIINFTYDRKIDIQCRKRYIGFIRKHSTVWGTNRSLEKILQIKDINFSINTDDIFSKSKNIINQCEKIFLIKNIPIKGYIITTPFSMINDHTKKISKKGIIYFSIFNINHIRRVIAHEIFHIYFEKYTKRQILNYETSKEYYTVILNDIFSSKLSQGYPELQKERKKVFDIWFRTKSIDACITKY